MWCLWFFVLGGCEQIFLYVFFLYVLLSPLINRSRSGPEALYPKLFGLKQPRWRVCLLRQGFPSACRARSPLRRIAHPVVTGGGRCIPAGASQTQPLSRDRSPENDSKSSRGGGRRRDPATDDGTSSSSGDGIATRSRGGTASASRGGGVRPQPEAVTMGLWLTGDTVLKKYSPPIRRILRLRHHRRWHYQRHGGHGLEVPQ